MSTIDSSQGSTASTASTSTISSDTSTTSTPFKFHGIGGEFFGIWIVNVLLTMVTFGIYSAWAKVRTNNYFYGNTELGGDRFEYLAKPMQILIGRIIAVFLLITWSVLSSTMPPVAVALAIIFMLAVPFLAVRNARFDARMTRFRNVRFDFAGSYGGAYINLLLKPIAAYIIVVAGGFGIGVVTRLMTDNPIAIGIAITAGVVFFFVAAIYSYAWVSAGMAQYLINGYRYGDKAFNAKLEINQYAKIAVTAIGLFFGAGLLFSVFAFAFGMMGSIVELIQSGASEEAFKNNASLIGMMFFGYFFMFILSMLIAAYVQVCVRNYVFSQTSINDDLQMASTMKTSSFLFLVITNLLLVMFTFGMGKAWADVRFAKYMAEVTAVEGNLDAFTAHDHNEQSSTAVADEVADAFDINIGIV
ncbi:MULTISPECIES: YjgN family protein [unclassified Shewanella]|uniref:YjgN family protein n=1 Tax=unclassified Shewanella TaxID=196818 RepID=UPI0017820ED4|nr:YjgN family protein [Shewanella sp. WPAGA9]